MTEVAEPTRGVAFDHTCPETAGPEFWDGVRRLAEYGPLTWVEDHGGYWAVTSYDLVRRVAQDWRTFSSAEGVALERPSPDVMPYILPIDFDPPRQRAYRKELNPHLAPTPVSRFEDGIRQIADELIDGFIEDGRCDLARDFARRLPGTVFFRLLVEEDDEVFRDVEPAARAISFDPDPNAKVQGSARLREWVASAFRAHEAGEKNADLVRAVMNLKDHDESFTEEELNSGVQLLAMGGIGTSSDLIGSLVVILSENQALQQRVRQNLDLVPALIEEGLRLEPPVTMMFRTATRDVEIEGRQIKAGQKVGLFFGAANRDGAEFDHPDELDIDRPRNPHLAFGAGVHRCVGSNLARLQVRIAIEQLLTRLGPFRIPPGAKVQYVSEQERGPSSIPLEFDPPQSAVAGSGLADS